MLRGQGPALLEGVEAVKVGIRALRLLAFVVVIWLVGEAVRVYYFKGDVDRFMRVADYVLKAWFPVFITAAGGSHFKRWTESLKNGKE